MSDRAIILVTGAGGFIGFVARCVLGWEPKTPLRRGLIPTPIDGSNSASATNCGDPWAGAE
jgi:hypothetical protein